MIRLASREYGRPGGLLAREWLETNGIGGYASSSLLNCNTRKYHGLLVANLPRPVCGRHVLLAGVAETVVVDGLERALSWCRFPGVLVPGGPIGLESFEADLVPTWEFRFGAVTVRRRIALLWEQDAVLIEYGALGLTEAVPLRVKSFVVHRRIHELTHENPFLDRAVSPTPDGFRVCPYSGMPSLWVQAAPPDGVRFAPEGWWYRQVEFEVEAERGYPAHEDWFCPGALELLLRPDQPTYVSAATEELQGLGGRWAAELARRRQATGATAAIVRRIAAEPAEQEILASLMRAAGQFVVRVPPDRPAVLAGYHWFEDWGRDTMIALPGLAFLTGGLARGEAVLRSLVGYERNGLLPNYVGPRDGEAAYNSVDACLWFFWTVQQYLRAGGAVRTVRESFWPCMKRILAALADGTAGNRVFLDSDGLLHSGTPDTQLTWMDALVDGRPVTPRWGYAVEICALWYNAVCFAAELAHALGDTSFTPPQHPEPIAAAFRRRFWLPAAGYLADVVNDAGVDEAVRPNQVFACSLPYSPLTAEMQRAVVDRVQDELLTPMGLRTLSPRDPRYRGRYSGDPATRDQAYHQGTVWPWLLGHFGEAYLRTCSDRRAACAFLKSSLRVWRDHLLEAGLGSVSEVFDGDPPHRPGGCVAQAWSVAELIRLYCLLGDPESCGS